MLSCTCIAAPEKARVISVRYCICMFPVGLGMIVLGLGLLMCEGVIRVGCVGEDLLGLQ